MEHRKIIRGIFSVIILGGFGCAGISLPLDAKTQFPTTTPNEDATVAAIVTDINAPPSLVAWISTVNTFGTQAELPPTKSLVLDGNWDGKGFTSDSTNIYISMSVTNNQIVDITIDYEGAGGASCQIRASATEADFKADFLPVKIDAYGNVQLGEWGLNTSFYRDNKANGNMKTHITGQSKPECNINIEAMWSAGKQQ